MNLILLAAEELAGGPTLTLSGRRALHVHDVLRARVGDRVAVGEIDGRIGQALLRSVTPEQVTLDVTLDADPPPPLGIELLLAIPRPKILRKVLQAAASMGCKRIALVKSYRVEKSYLASPLLAPEGMREELLLGLEQARDTVVPRISVHPLFKPFVEDELDDWFPGAQRLLPHPSAAGALPPCAPQPTALAIGPEGGWTPYEAALLESHGFVPFNAGPRVLRVDVAVPFLVGQVALRTLPPATASPRAADAPR